MSRPNANGTTAHTQKSTSTTKSYPPKTTNKRSKRVMTHHIELRDGRPHGKILDALSDGFVTENVDRMEINVVGLQYLASSVAESALREELASLHEQQDGVVVD